MTIGHLIPLVPAFMPLLATAIPTVLEVPPRTATRPRNTHNQSADASWVAYFLVDARRISALPLGWDGLGSKAPSEETLWMARHALTRALDGMPDAVAPRLVPAGDGSLQIEWHAEHGELEFCIDADGELWAWACDHLNGLEFEGSGEKAIAIFYRWAPRMAAPYRNEIDVRCTAEPAFFQIAA